ncbi:MAG: phosphodiester glycosidase family protein [Candidatus Marinimicrobia bacterium]|nr:phosphodiester glycosidase family protein [Candidatus Neomarinimicrobiota bacterium]
MKKLRLNISLILFLLLSAQFLMAELPEIITTRVRQVGPGVIQRTLEAPSKPWMIYVLEVDIQDPALQIRAIDGAGLQKPSVIASAEEATNYRLVGATNGDFYEPDQTTTNAGVVNGKITKLEKLSTDNPVYWSALSIGENNMPTISCNKFEGYLSVNGNTMAIDDLNEARNVNELVFYNHYKGSSTGTSGGVEIRLWLVDGWMVNDTMRCVMGDKSTNGNMTLATATAVISGDGTAATFLQNNYSTGDTLDVLLKMRAFEDLSISGVSYNYLPLVKPLKHLIGGYPMFIRNGLNYAIEGYRNENGGGSFATDLHPRTAAGFNEDTTKMYFVVVDGRQTSSIGIDLVDLADIMLELGAWRAMNFDGGGSSVMIAGHEIVNSPSDGVERSVRNCWAIYSTAAEGELSQIQIELDTMRIYRKQSFDFAASGWDVNYNPKTVTNWGNVQIFCDSSIGTITGGEGSYTFTASREGIEGYVYSDLNGVICDSMLIKPISIDPIIISPSNSMTDTIKTIQFRIKGVNDKGDTISVINSVFDFTVSDSTIGIIDQNGIFSGLSAGTTKVYVHYGSQSDSTNVRVYLGEGEYSLDRIENINTWELSGENLDTVNTMISVSERSDGVNDSYAMRIDYKTTNNGKIYLSKDIEVPGIPEVIMLDVLSDGLNHRMYVNLEDALGNTHTVYQSGYVNNADNYETLFMDASGIDAVYPIRIRNIYIKLKTGIQEGTLYIDDLRMTYPGNTAIYDKNADQILPDDFILHRSYPNPFNPSTTISYELRKDADTELSLYNIRGELVEVILKGYQSEGTYKLTWTAGEHPSGYYIFKLRVGDKTKIGKMLLLK